MIYHYNKIASIDFTFRISLLKYNFKKKIKQLKFKKFAKLQDYPGKYKIPFI